MSKRKIKVQLKPKGSGVGKPVKIETIKAPMLLHARVVPPTK